MLPQIQTHSKNKFKTICAKTNMGFCFIGSFDATYDYKLLEKLIYNHSIFGLSILFFFKLCNFNSRRCHFDFLRGLLL